MKKKKLFDIVISVEENGEGGVSSNITCRKDGKNFTQDALEGKNLAIACECLRGAMGVFAQRYLHEMKKQGVLSEEEYNRITNNK